MGGTTSSNTRRISHSPKDGRRTPVRELGVGYVALKENLEIYSIPANNTGNTGGGRNAPASSRTKSITFSLKSLLTSSKQTGSIMADSVSRDDDSRDSSVGAGGVSRGGGGGGVFMKLSRRMLNGRVSNSSSCSNQSAVGPESRIRQGDLLGPLQRLGANGQIHYEDEGHVSMHTGQTIGQRRSDTSGGIIGHGGGGGGGYFGGRTSCVQPIDDNIVSVIAYTDKISPAATAKVHCARSNSVVDQRSSYPRSGVIKNNSIVCDVIRNGYNGTDTDVTYGVASENNGKDRHTVGGVSHAIPKNCTILNNKKNGNAVVGIRMEDSPLTVTAQSKTLPVEQCVKSSELVSCDSSSTFTSFPNPILSQNKNNAAFVGKNNNRVNIISQTTTVSSSNNISHVQTSTSPIHREFYTNNNFLKNDMNLNNGHCGQPPTTNGSKKKVLRASTWELLLCLNEFIREHCVRLSRTDTQDAVVWLRQADRSLLASGWQDTTFINPANVVFLYLLVRDVLTLRGDEIDSAEDLRATLLVCLYLAYTYMGNEISYPLKPFLVAVSANVTCSVADSQGGQLSRGGARSSSAPAEQNMRSAAPPPVPPPVVDRQTRLKFWDRCLDLVERMSTQMLRLNSDPIFFVETLKDLRSYSAEHIKDLV